jgi:hypothetical protein
MQIMNSATGWTVRTVIWAAMFCTVAGVAHVRGDNWEDLPPLKLDGTAAHAAKVSVELADSGLPAQLTIQADASELPLELRGKAVGEAPAEVLAAIGRGPQLRVPVRIEAVADGKTSQAVARRAAALVARDDGSAVAESVLAVAGVSIEVRTIVMKDGSLLFELACGGGVIDSLALVVEPSGPVDTVVAGDPGAEALRTDLGALALPLEDGIVWGNATGTEGPAAAAGAVAPGVVAHAYVGSGDRGFTWLADHDGGWINDPRQPMMTIERDKDLRPTWRMMLVNTRATLGADRRFRFALLTHPSRTRPGDARRRAWLDWPAKAVAAPATGLTIDARAAGGAAVQRADGATVYEAVCKLSLLAGSAGGLAASRDLTIAGTFPMPLFRFLSGRHTGVPARLAPGVGEPFRPGMSRSCDRAALGRALLHDIGIDVSKLAHVTDGARVAAALQRMGAFDADGGTEFIPYWRADRILRLGQRFERNNRFEITEDDPLADVYVSVYRRRIEGGAMKSLIVVVNEGDEPVRDFLYLLDTETLFGGPNTFEAVDCVDGWDMALIPPDSDWSRSRLRSSVLDHGGSKGAPRTSLRDEEDDGFVRLHALKDGQEIYGLLFVPPKSFRLLSGESRPGKRR